MKPRTILLLGAGVAVIVEAISVAVHGARIGGWEGYKCRRTLGVFVAAPLPEVETSCSDSRYFRLDREPFMARFPIDAARYEAFARSIPSPVELTSDDRAFYEHFLRDDARVGGPCRGAPHSADCATCRVASMSGQTLIADWVDGCAVVEIIRTPPWL